VKKPPAYSNQFLEVAYDDQAGEVIIGRVRLRPVSPGCEDIRVRNDYASVVADIVSRIRDDLWKRMWADYRDKRDD
jgi:hypothetical protein